MVHLWWEFSSLPPCRSVLLQILVLPLRPPESIPMDLIKMGFVVFAKRHLLNDLRLTEHRRMYCS
jgi:hypothetical protein